MKFTYLSSALFGLLTLSAASPLVKRASPTENASTGYATLNGGTSGGLGGSTVTVSSLAALQSAVKADTAAIVIISGTITGDARVDIGSNTSLLGKDSNAGELMQPRDEWTSVHG